MDRGCLGFVQCGSSFPFFLSESSRMQKLVRDFLFRYVNCQPMWCAWGRLIFCGLVTDGGGGGVGSSKAVSKRAVSMQRKGKLLSTASRLTFLNYTYDMHPNSRMYDFHNIMLEIPPIVDTRNFQPK